MIHWELIGFVIFLQICGIGEHLILERFREYLQNNCPSKFVVEGFIFGNRDQILIRKQIETWKILFFDNKGSVNMNSEKFSLKWNDFQQTVSNSFGTLRREQDFFDVTLHSGKVH